MNAKKVKDNVREMDTKYAGNMTMIHVLNGEQLIPAHQNKPVKLVIVKRHALMNASKGKLFVKEMVIRCVVSTMQIYALNGDNLHHVEKMRFAKMVNASAPVVMNVHQVKDNVQTMVIKHVDIMTQIHV
jgi:hypothetical protein